MFIITPVKICKTQHCYVLSVGIIMLFSVCKVDEYKYQLNPGYLLVIIRPLYI